MYLVLPPMIDLGMVASTNFLCCEFNSIALLINSHFLLCAPLNSMINCKSCTYAELFDHSQVSFMLLQENLAEDRKEMRVLIKKINSALDFLRNQQLEVPFINFYRKEYVQGELEIRDLWRIWQWDEKVCGS